MRFDELNGYTFNESLMIRKVGEIAMVYNKDNGDMYEFNDIGAEILFLLNEQKPISDVLTLLANEYDAEMCEIKKDVYNFIERTIELGIISISEVDYAELFKIEYDKTLGMEEYQELRNSVGWEEISDKQAQAGIDSSDCIVVARVNGRAVGCVRCIWDKGYTLFVMDAIVRPEWQRKGIGTKILNELISNMSNKVFEGEKLMINLYSSVGKESFYEKNGFVKGSGMVKWIRK